MALLKSGKIYQIKFFYSYAQYSAEDVSRKAFIDNYIEETEITDEKYTTIYNDKNKYFINLPYINEPIKDSNDNEFHIGLDLTLDKDALYGIKNTEIITDPFIVGSCCMLESADYPGRYRSQIGSDNFWADFVRDMYLVIDTHFLDTHGFYTITLASNTDMDAGIPNWEFAFARPTIFICDMVDQVNGDHCDGFFTLGAPLYENKTKYIEGYVVQDGQYIKQNFIPQKYFYDGEFILQKVQFGRFRSDNIYLTNAYNQINSHNDFVLNLDYRKSENENNGWLDDILYCQNKKFLLGRNLWCDTLSHQEAGSVDTETYSYQYIPVIEKMKEIKPEIKGCLEFSSDGYFSLRAYHNWDGVIEYSIDNKTWVEWDGSELGGSAEQSIYLRGTGNTKLTGGSWPFTGKYIKGNIETLLDYQTVLNKEHPVMSDYCFAWMFENCRSLVEAPDISMETLSKHCCYYMFAYCISLVKAPKISATALDEDCCSSMFRGCTSLIQMPKLPATTLPGWCYYNMFRDCSKIKLSEVKNEEYKYEYRIPSEGTGTDEYGSMYSMFYNTGGTFTDTPLINTTYYTSNEVV